MRRTNTLKWSSRLPLTSTAWTVSGYNGTGSNTPMIAVPHGVDWVLLGFCALWLTVPVGDVWRRKRAGALLLDLCGSEDWLGFVIGGGLITTSFFTQVVFFAPGTQWWPLIALSGMGFGFLASRNRRFQLREAGMLRPGRLIPWDRIEVYELSSIGSLSLKIPGRSWTFYCDVPPELRLKAENLLASRCRALQRV